MLRRQGLRPLDPRKPFEKGPRESFRIVIGKLLVFALKFPDRADGDDLGLDFGNGDVRNVFSGIREFYKPEDLVGRIVVAVANLASRKMRFGVSTCAPPRSASTWAIPLSTVKMRP